MIKSLLVSTVLLIGMLGTFYLSLNYFEALIYSEANVENNIILRDIVHYKPLMLYYKGNNYIFYTINSTEPIFIKDIESTNGSTILYINEYSKYAWNVSRIDYNGEKTVLYIQLGNTQGYIIGKSNLTPLIINETLESYASRSQVNFSAYNYGNIPVYLLYIVISAWETLYITGNSTLHNGTLHYQHIYKQINIDSWEFPGNYYKGNAYFVNLTNYTITLYYKDIIGESSISHSY